VEDDAGKDFVLFSGLLFIKVNKTTIVVISAYARFISDMPVLLLGCVFTCYGPSAFYLAVVEQNRKATQRLSRDQLPGSAFQAPNATVLITVLGIGAALKNSGIKDAHCFVTAEKSM
jgi:hypothetical protein